MAEIHFNPSPEEVAKARKNDDWYQKYTAEECQMAIVYIFGRWIVYWRIWELETEDAPEDQHWEVLRVQYSTTDPNRLTFHGV